jgi:hypothetical protein
MGVVLMVLMLTVTAGLGVIALLEVPAGGAVIASFLVERYRRARRRPVRGGVSPPPA